MRSFWADWKGNGSSRCSGTALTNLSYSSLQAGLTPWGGEHPDSMWPLRMRNRCTNSSDSKSSEAEVVTSGIARFTTSAHLLDGPAAIMM